jgi:predicted alpha/beta superfamily hydrolase
MPGAPTDDDLPIAGTEVHYLHSEAVGDEFKIFVGHCGNTERAQCPALYVGDANGMFASAVDTIRFMQLSAHLPPMLVVGVGYRMGGIAGTEVVRARDFTPTHDPLFARVFPQHTMIGGADRFLSFIGDELQPWVRERYDIDPADTAFFGHSMGGLFATYVLLTAPATFAKYGIGSPSLWWHGDMMFAYEEQYAATHDDLDAKVFFSVGEYEDHEGRLREASRQPPEQQAAAGLRYIDMVADTERMVSAMRGRRYPGLDVENVVLPGEFHVTVPIVNLSRSLRYLFDAPR